MEGYRKSMPKLAHLGIEALMPGHGSFALTAGQEHVDAALGSYTYQTTSKYDLLIHSIA